MRDVEEVRRAKERLKIQIKDEPWYRGIGIAPGADGPIIRLNVAAEADPSLLPDSVDGIPVEVVRIDGYAPR